MEKNTVGEIRPRGGMLDYLGGSNTIILVLIRGKHSQRQKNRMRDGSGLWDPEPRGVNTSRTWESGLQMDAALQTP